MPLNMKTISTKQLANIKDYFIITSHNDLSQITKHESIPKETLVYFSSDFTNHRARRYDMPCKNVLIMLPNLDIDDLTRISYSYDALTRTNEHLINTMYIHIDESFKEE